MNVAFYIAAAVAVTSTAVVVTRLNVVHALLYLIVSLMAVAMVFFTLGAPFVAALEVIIYAGAIMVLFVFVIMILNLGPQTIEQEREWLNPKAWAGPTILVGILLVELVYVLVQGGQQPTAAGSVSPKEVGIALFGTYSLGAEMASMVLLAGLVGAYHLGRRPGPEEQKKGGA
jgi:NADH-quinone oxidoreductase subunit J